MRYSLLLLLLPLAEIAAFVVVGKAIGALATVGLTVISSVIGLLLLRSAGAGILRKLAGQGRDGQAPGRELVQGGMTVFGSILLIIPGFITDCLGLLLLIPVVRQSVWKLIGQRLMAFQSRAQAYSTSTRGPTYSGPSARSPHSPEAAGPIIDLDEEDFSRKPAPARSPGSPWSIGGNPEK